jgi:hypothetical protein
MDRLLKSHFLDELKGRIYLHQFEALADLDPACARAAVEGTAATTVPRSPGRAPTGR